MQDIYLNSQSASSASSQHNRRQEIDQMQARHVQLRPIRPEDYPFLYELATSEDAGYRWRYYGNFPTYDSFVQTFQRNDNPQFIVVRCQDDERAGWVFSYKFDPTNGTVYMGIAMSRPYIGTGVGLETAGLFVNYLFRYWNLRKVYSEAPGYTFDSVASGIGTVFKEEGVLKAHRYYNGRFWDEHIIAIYKEDWENLRPLAPWLSEDLSEDSYRHPRQW